MCLACQQKNGTVKSRRALTHTCRQYGKPIRTLEQVQLEDDAIEKQIQDKLQILRSQGKIK